MPEGGYQGAQDGAYWARVDAGTGALTEEVAWNLEQDLCVEDWVRVSPGDAAPYYWKRGTEERLHDFREARGDSWERVVPADGRVYFWQSETGHRQWDDPASASNYDGFSMLEEDAGGGWLRVIQEHAGESAEDDTVGKAQSWYYHHPETGHSVWAEGEGDDDAYIPAVVMDTGDDDDDDDDVWADDAEDPEALAAAAAHEVEMAAKRRQFLKATASTPVAGPAAKRGTIIAMQQGPYAHAAGLSDEEGEEEPGWGMATLQKTLNNRMEQGAAGEDFDSDHRMKRAERRESWLSKFAKQHSGGSILVSDLGARQETTAAQLAQRRHMLQGQHGGGSILVADLSHGDDSGDSSAAAARRKRFLMGGRTGGSVLLSSDEVKDKAAARRKLFLMQEDAPSPVPEGNEEESPSPAATKAAAAHVSLVDQMKQTGAAEGIPEHPSGPHKALAERMRETQAAQAEAKRRRAFLNQGGGAEGANASMMVNRARALSVRASRVSMLGSQ